VAARTGAATAHASRTARLRVRRESVMDMVTSWVVLDFGRIIASQLLPLGSARIGA